MPDILLLVIAAFFLLIFVAIIAAIAVAFLVVWLAARKRMQQQTEILKQLPAGTGFKMAMRYNKGEQHRKLIKFLPWQGSGVLFVLDGKIYFWDILGGRHGFDLGKVKIQWVGMNFANGFTEWFKIADDHVEHYFNVEAGIFAFDLTFRKMTTYQVYKTLESLQAQMSRAG